MKQHRPFTAKKLLTTIAAISLVGMGFSGQLSAAGKLESGDGPGGER